MSDIDWRDIWDSTIKNAELFPIKKVTKTTLSIACPTRFSGAGEMSIDFTPSFNDESISLEMLLFNDNLSLNELEFDEKELGKNDKDSFNKLAKQLVEFELSNRVMDRYTIKSDGFDSDKEAEKTLVDYINSKATESGRMFDDKLDELNDALDAKKEESYTRTLNSIRENRRTILKKVESILKYHYKWNTLKNEDFADSSVPFYDRAGNLAAVVSIADDCLVVDLATNITAKVSMLQSDEDIETELTSDIDNAQSVLADQEIEHLKDVISDNNVAPEVDYLEALERRLTKLESLYINRKLRRIR